MTSHDDGFARPAGRRPGNPFRASHTRPGTLPFLFANGDSIEALVQRFLDGGRSGQIVGPHGSGKTTLLVDILSCLRSRGVETLHLRIDAERGWTRTHRQQVDRLSGSRVVAIDGFDQLPWRSRIWLRMRLSCRSVGLLVTTHQVQRGLPVLRQTSVDERIARGVIRAYLERAVPGTTDEQCHGLLAGLPQRLQRFQGNLREVLFELYEHWQDDVSVRSARGPTELCD